MRNNFTRFMSVILAVLLIVSVVPLSAVAASKYKDGYYTYNVKNQKASITAVDKSISGDITIPAKLGGYEVTGIDDRAFKNCTAVEGITIPDTVTVIGHYAFSGCEKLSDIKIPDSVTSIGVFAFSDTAYYNNPENWFDGVFYIGNHLIKAKPEEVSGDYKVKNGTTVIIRDAFNSCDNIKSITIPSSVMAIEEFAFQYADIESIIVDKNNSNYSSDSCGALFNKEKTEIIKYPAGNKREEYTVPASVTVIGADAFRSCNTLKHLTIAGPVTTIGRFSFSCCSGLEGIILPDTVEKIEADAFNECTSLKSITLPASLKSIGAYSFTFCTDLKSVVIPDSVTCIDAFAFSYCTSLESVSLGNSVEKIDMGAFSTCYKLKSIKLPENITTITNSMFLSCTALESIIIPGTVKAIEYVAFAGCTNLKDVYFTGTEKEWKKIKIDKDNDILNNVTIHYNYSEQFFTDSATAKLVDNNVLMTFGMTAENLLSQVSNGAVIKDSKGNKLDSDKCPGTGMTLVMPDGKEHTIVVLGDVEGDGVITSADARLALRTAVGLENYKENSAQYKAANVERKDKISAADARLILRAAVGLEDTKSWLK